jgi:hypothetical protein
MLKREVVRTDPMITVRRDFARVDPQIRVGLDLMNCMRMALGAQFGRQRDLTDALFTRVGSLPVTGAGGNLSNLLPEQYVN